MVLREGIFWQGRKGTLWKGGKEFYGRQERNFKVGRKGILWQRRNEFYGREERNLMVQGGKELYDVSLGYKKFKNESDKISSEKHKMPDIFP